MNNCVALCAPDRGEIIGEHVNDEDRSWNIVKC